MPIYHLPCPQCSGRIEVDTDYEESVECESCDRAFGWRWGGRGRLALFQFDHGGNVPDYYYGGVGRYRASEDVGRKIRVYAENKTSFTLRIAVKYLGVNGEWMTKAWFVFEPGEKARLPVQTRNRSIYFYACDQGSDAEWTGDHTSMVGEKEYNFFVSNIGEGIRKFTQQFS